MLLSGAFTVSIEVLGLIAGTIIMTSAIPQLVANIRDAADVASQSLGRNIALVAGNALWVVYGAMKGAPSIAMMCAIAALLNGGVAVQVFRSRRRSTTSDPASVD